jgi:hypothetical protein
MIHVISTHMEILTKRTSAILAKPRRSNSGGRRAFDVLARHIGLHTNCSSRERVGQVAKNSGVLFLQELLASITIKSWGLLLAIRVVAVLDRGGPCVRLFFLILCHFKQSGDLDFIP